MMYDARDVSEHTRAPSTYVAQQYTGGIFATWHIITITYRQTIKRSVICYIRRRTTDTAAARYLHQRV